MRFDHDFIFQDPKEDKKDIEALSGIQRLHSLDSSALDESMEIDMNRQVHPLRNAGIIDIFPFFRYFMKPNVPERKFKNNL